jgi:hypothetical protein
VVSCPVTLVVETESTMFLSNESVVLVLNETLVPTLVAVGETDYGAIALICMFIVLLIFCACGGSGGGR